MATAFLQDGVGYEDMAKLQDLHEGSILDNIKQRYEKDRIYVSISIQTYKISSSSHFVNVVFTIEITF